VSEAMHSAKTTIRDRQVYPFVLLPKALFTHRLSLKALGAYTAIKFFASNASGKSEHVSVPTMAALVDLSVDGFRRGVNELVKKKLLRVRRHSKRTSGGKKLNLPNVYEILNLHQPEAEKI
jgi:hypothetical protein